MNDDNKLFAYFWFCVLSAVLAITFGIVYVHTHDTPGDLQKQQLEYQYKMACIQAHGTWGSTDNDNRAPYSCKR